MTLRSLLFQDCNYLQQQSHRQHQTMNSLHVAAHLLPVSSWGERIWYALILDGPQVVWWCNSSLHHSFYPPVILHSYNECWFPFLHQVRYKSTLKYTTWTHCNLRWICKVVWCRTGFISHDKTQHRRAFFVVVLLFCLLCSHLLWDHSVWCYNP